MVNFKGNQHLRIQFFWIYLDIALAVYSPLSTSKLNSQIHAVQWKIIKIAFFCTGNKVIAWIIEVKLFKICYKHKFDNHAIIDNYF